MKSKLTLSFFKFNIFSAKSLALYLLPFLVLSLAPHFAGAAEAQNSEAANQVMEISNMQKNLKVAGGGAQGSETLRQINKITNIQNTLKIAKAANGGPQKLSILKQIDQINNIQKITKLSELPTIPKTPRVYGGNLPANVIQKNYASAETGKTVPNTVTYSENSSKIVKSSEPAPSSRAKKNAERSAWITEFSKAKSAQSTDARDAQTSFKSSVSAGSSDKKSAANTASEKPKKGFGFWS